MRPRPFVSPVIGVLSSPSITGRRPPSTSRPGDIVQLARLEDRGRPFVVGVQNETQSSHGEPLTRITLYRAGGKKPLTELMPALEDMGLQVVEEVPTRLKGAGKHFIHDFGVLSPTGHTIDVEECGGRIAEVLEQIWGGVSDTDSLNELVIVAGLSARQVHILRAYRTYWRTSPQPLHRQLRQ